MNVQITDEQLKYSVIAQLQNSINETKHHFAEWLNMYLVNNIDKGISCPHPKEIIRLYKKQHRRDCVKDSLIPFNAAIPLITFCISDAISKTEQTCSTPQ